MSKTSILGKIFEQQIFAKLLSLGFEVFLPVVDDRGVDCVVKNQNNKFIELQIKGRRKDSRNIFNVKNFKPRNNYYFILIDKNEKTYIIPSFTVHEWLDGKKKFSLLNTKKIDFLDKYGLLAQ